MIASEKIDSAFEWNVGRPDLRSEDDHRFWKAFHSLVESWPAPIGINGAYGYIQSHLDAGTGYGGGGMAYKFWFTTEQDMIEFKEAVKKI